MEHWDPLKAAYALFENARNQQEQAMQLLQQLRQATDKFSLTTQALPSKVTAHMNETLTDAAKAAAVEIAANWTDANLHAERAAEAYRKAVRFAPAKVFGLAALCFALGAGAMIVIGCWVLPKGDLINQWRSEEMVLRANIKFMEQHGARTQFADCTDVAGQKRLCVQVDEQVKTKLRGYRVVRGY